VQECVRVPHSEGIAVGMGSYVSKLGEVRNVQ
jgi:hypothetical protein